MLSSMVNSLTYRVLSTCVFTYLWQFFSNLYILLWQTNYEICRLFWWNMTQLWLVLFAFTFGALFGKSLLSMQCLGPKLSKMCIFWTFFAWFCTVFLWDYLRTFSNYLSPILFHFFLQKSCFFSCFSRKKRIIMISASTRWISDNSGLTMHSGHLVVVMVHRNLFVDSRAVN